MEGSRLTVVDASARGEAARAVVAHPDAGPRHQASLQCNPDADETMGNGSGREHHNKLDVTEAGRTPPNALGGGQGAAHDEEGAEDAADQLREDVGDALQDRDVAGDHGGDGDGRGDVAAAEVGCHVDCTAEGIPG